MAKPTPITIRGVTYPSQSAAARALDISQSNLTAMLRAGTIDNAGKGRNLHSQKIMLDGKEYASMSHAADELDVNPTTVRTAVQTARDNGRTSAVVRGRVLTW